MVNVLLECAQGRLRGVVDRGTYRYYGIPYAAAPIGARRFLAPEPASAWSGERDATQKGPNAPQINRKFPGLDATGFIGDGWRTGDEYLCLNVWTPDPKGKAPVMVFIHGGAFVAGTGDAPAYNGRNFARDGIVCVTLNYRMGIDGFLPLAGADTNLGLRDQLAALHWVKAHIAAFGGDASNVTVFGESAGAMSIANLLGSPLAEGLFRRAIIESGHGRMLHSFDCMQRVIQKLAEVLAVPATAEGFARRSLEDCAKAVDAVSQPGVIADLREPNGLDPAFGLSKFLPVVGDDVIPVASEEAVAGGMGSNVELLIGSNLEEMNIYFVPPGICELDDEIMARFLLGQVFPRADEALLSYGLGKGKKPGLALTEAMSDLVFRQPVRDFALAHRGHTHVYEFGWRSTAFQGRLGACHALELPFVFDTLATCSGPEGLVGESAPQDLADHVHALWAGFARDGSLPWPEFEAGRREVYRLEERRSCSEDEFPAVQLKV